MRTAELRQQVKKQIDELPITKLRTAATYIAKLKKTSKLPAADLRKIANMKKVIAQSEEDFAAGRGVSLESLKRKY